MKNQYENITHCKWGHEFTPENTYVKIRKRSGREERYCKTCMHDRYLKIWSNPKRKEAIKLRNREWLKKNPDKARALDRAYKERNRIALRARQREERKHRTDQLRKEAIEAYGGKCVWCGDSRNEVLHFDHVNNDGSKHRKEEGLGSAADIYIWAKRNGWPDRLQLLCADCHNMKTHYGMTREDVVNDEALIGAGC